VDDAGGERHSPAQLLTLLFIVHFSLFAQALLAQAWVSPQGDGVVSVLYQYDIARLHAYDDGRTRDKGHTYFDAVVADADFSFTNRLAVRVTMPFIEAAYIGSAPHVLVRGQPDTAVELDNGKYHGGFQDFRFNVRYALAQGALKITPLFQATLPTHDYPTLGHAAIGINEKEYRVGVNVGRRLNPILPKAFIQAQYAFGMTPELGGNIAPKRSYGELQLGYLVNRRISIQGASVLTYSHNGIDFDYNLFPGNLSDVDYLNHDRINRVKMLDAGGTVAYQVNRSTNVFVSIGHSFYGENTHLRYLVATVGFSKSFTTKLSDEKASVLTAQGEAAKALVCTCAKSR
jgi:hypothetical protein